MKNLKCLLGFHKWVFAERKPKKKDFIEGCSPIYFYEKCEKCNKEKHIRKRSLTKAAKKVYNR